MKNRRFFLVTLIIVSLLCIFVIPYYVPLSEQSVSMSYDVGFNNKVGIILVGFWAMLFVGFGLYRVKSFKQYAPVVFSFTEKISSRVLYWVLGITIFSIVVLWMLVGRKTLGVLDAGYFIPHVYDLVFGKEIYVDFEYSYGPLLVYIPYWLYVLLPISVSDGYFLCLILLQAIGVYFLYLLFSALNISCKEKKVIFILFVIIVFPYSLGLNYELFRFIFPLWGFFYLRKMERRTGCIWSYILMCVLLSFLILLTSPEFGIAFICTLLVYLLFSLFFSKNWYYILPALLIIAVFWGVLMALPGYLHFLFVFTSGGMNWPFIPCLTLIAFFISIFVISFFIGMQLHQIKDNLFILSFELLVFSFIPAALGRCDPVHIIFNGMMVFVLSYVYIIFFCQKFKKVDLVVLILVCSMIFPYQIRMYIPAYITEIIKSHVDYMPHFVLNKLESSIYFSNKISELNENGIQNYSSDFAEIENISMLSVNNNGIYVHLNKEKKFVDIYYRNLGLVGNRKSLERVLDDMKSKNIDYILLPPSWDDLDNPANYSAVNLLFCTYYPFNQIHNGNELYAELLSYIGENYTFEKRIGTDLLYKKNR